MLQRVVIINCFDTYEHRVHLLKKYFVSCGKDVHVITSDWRHFQKKTRTECPDGFELIHAKPYYKNFSVARLKSHYLFANEAGRRVKQIRPELLWVLVPPNSLVKTSVAYKKRFPKTKLVLDFIDMWPETMPISMLKKVPPFSFWRDLRDNHVYAADAIVTECALYQKILQNKCDSNRMHTLYLAREIVQHRPTLELPPNCVSLCYLGSINNIIDISCIGQIIKKIDASVELHIIGDGERKQELIDTATAAGANVIFHGKIYDPNMKKQIFDKCHFGLNIMKNSVCVGLTMKSMDYFEYGLPIINNIKGDTWEFVENFDVGINYDSKVQFDMEELMGIARERENVRAFFEKNFSYDSFADGVSRIICTLNKQ